MVVVVVMFTTRAEVYVKRLLTSMIQEHNIQGNEEKENYLV